MKSALATVIARNEAISTYLEVLHPVIGRLLRATKFFTSKIISLGSRNDGKKWLASQTSLREPSHAGREGLGVFLQIISLGSRNDGKKWLVIFLLLLAQSSFSQTLDKSFALFAKFHSLHDSMQVEDIGNRILFFDSLGLYREKTEQMMGSSLEFAGHYKEASYHYKEAALVDYSTAAIEGLARCQLATQNYEDCLKTLEKLESPTANLYFLTASAYYGLGRMDTCEILFGQFVKRLSVKDSVALHKLLQKAAKNEKLNPIIARNLSFILPGLGQLYAGDIKNGINSMALNAFLIWGFIHTWQVYSFLDSYIAIFPWMQRYYFGSAVHARDIAEKIKARKKEKYFGEILKVLAM